MDTEILEPLFDYAQKSQQELRQTNVFSYPLDEPHLHLAVNDLLSEGQRFQLGVRTRYGDDFLSYTVASEAFKFPVEILWGQDGAAM